MIKKIIVLAMVFGSFSPGNVHAQVPVTGKAPGSLVVVTSTPANVDIDAYEQLVKEVKEHRKERMVNIDTFTKMSREQNVVILDTRSDSMYKAMHIKGAIHLAFTDFTQDNLRKLIPDPNTKILIYCNNNFSDDLSLVSVTMAPLLSYVPTKMSYPRPIDLSLAAITSQPIKSTGKKSASTASSKPAPAKTKSAPAPTGAATQTTTETVTAATEAAPAPVLAPTPAPRLKQLTLALNIPTYINLYGYGYQNVFELSELIYISMDPRIEYEGTAVDMLGLTGQAGN